MHIHFTPSPLIHDNSAPYQCCTLFRKIRLCNQTTLNRRKGVIFAECSEFYKGVIIMAKKMPCRVNVSTLFVTYCGFVLFLYPGRIGIWKCRFLRRNPKNPERNPWSKGRANNKLMHRKWSILRSLFEGDHPDIFRLTIYSSVVRATERCSDGYHEYLSVHV